MVRRPGAFILKAPTTSYTLTLKGGLTNNSASAQVVAVPVALGGTQVFNNSGAGNLVLSNSLANDLADSLTGGVTVAGTNAVVFAGNNSYSGPTTVSGGSILQLDDTANNSDNAMSGNSPLILNNGSTVQLRSDASTTFTPAGLTLQNVADILSFDVNSLTGATGKTLTLAGTFNNGINNAETINVTGNSSYTLALGNFVSGTGSHNPYYEMAFNTTPAGPGLSLGSILTGNYSQWLNFQGGGKVTLTGSLTNVSNGSAVVYVTDGTALTFEGASWPVANRQRPWRTVTGTGGERHLGVGQQRRADQQHGDRPAGPILCWGR